MEDERKRQAHAEFKKIAEELGAKGVVTGSMFGKPCMKIAGKAFSCLFGDAMVFKLAGSAHAEALTLSGSKLFDPSGRGRPMREWVQLPLEHAEQWERLADHAFQYVAGPVR